MIEIPVIQELWNWVQKSLYTKSAYLEIIRERYVIIALADKIEELVFGFVEIS